MPLFCLSTRFWTVAVWGKRCLSKLLGQNSYNVPWNRPYKSQKLYWRIPEQHSSKIYCHNWWWWERCLSSWYTCRIYIYICMTIYTSGTHSNQLAAWRTALPINTLCTATQPRKCASEQKYTSLNKCGWDLVTEGYGVWWHYYNNIIFIHIKPSSEPSCPVNGDIVTIIRIEMLQPWIKVMSQNSIVLICSDSSL